MRLYSLFAKGLLAFCVGIIPAIGDASFESPYKLLELIGYQKTDTGWVGKCLTDKGEKVEIRVDLCRPDLARIRVSPKGGEPVRDVDNQIIIMKDWPKVGFSLQETPGGFQLATEVFRISVGKKPFTMIVNDRDGKLLTELGVSGDEPAAMNYILAPNIRVNVRAQTLNRSYGFPSPPLGMSTSVGAWGTVSNDEFDYYFMCAKDVAGILQLNAELTGHPPIPPRWSFGFWMGFYENQAGTLAVARRLRQERIPCDNLWLDSNWLNEDGRGPVTGGRTKFVDFRFSRDQFSDPKAMIDQLKGMNYHFGLWQAPNVNPECKEEYEEINRNQYFVRRVDGSPRFFGGAWHNFTQAYMIDFTNSKARDFWKKLQKRATDLGAEWFKIDAGWVFPDCVFSNGRTGDSMSSLYAMLYHKTVYEGLREALGKRTLIITHSHLYAGHQRYGGIWADDNVASFDSLRRIFQNGLVSSLSGSPYWTDDTGGYIGFGDSQVYARWLWGLLNPWAEAFKGPVGGGGFPWLYDDRTLDTFRRYVRLRYRLIPYYYSYARVAHETGAPLMRPLLYEFPEDPRVYGEDTQWSIGREIMIAPIYARSDRSDGMATRQVYLPPGTWFDFWSSRQFSGPATISYDAPFDTVPIFIRGGSIIPMGPVMQYVDEKACDPIELHCWPAEKPAAFTLYEDDGKTFDYEKALFSKIAYRLSSDRKSKKVSLELSAPQGNYPGRIDHSYFAYVYATPKPGLVQLDSQKLAESRTQNDLELLPPDVGGWRYDQDLARVVIRVPVVKVATVVSLEEIPYPEPRAPAPRR